MPASTAPDAGLDACGDEAARTLEIGPATVQKVKNIKATAAMQLNDLFLSDMFQILQNDELCLNEDISYRNRAPHPRFLFQSTGHALWALSLRGGRRPTWQSPTPRWSEATPTPKRPTITPTVSILTDH